MTENSLAMASKGIAQIKPKHRPFKLEVRVLRKYIPYTGAQESKEQYYLLIDAHGDAIEAKVDKNNRKIDMLIKLQGCYAIDGYVCTVQRSSGRVVDHPASIIIGERASITRLADRAISTFHFNFADNSMLEKRLDDENVLLTDYLGRVESSTGIYKKKNKNMLKLKLLDQSGYVVDLTLWEKIAFAFTKEDVTGKILAVGSAKVTDFHGKLQLESTDVTITHINPPLHDLQDIIDSYQNIQPRPAPYSAMQLSNRYTESGMNLAELKLKEPAEYKNKFYTCEATMKQFYAEHGWFKRRCPHSNCDKKLHEELSDSEDDVEKPNKLICEDGHPVPAPKYLYCINGILMDDTAVLPVVIFDDAMSPALGRTCNDLVLNDSYDDVNIIPDPMLALIGVPRKYTIRLRQNMSAVVQHISSALTDIDSVQDNLLMPSSEPQTPASKITRKQSIYTPDGKQPATKKMKGKKD